MGYVHRTPAWVRPHGAGERRTFWGVIPGAARPEDRPLRSERLPPHPRDVPLPPTFADWYTTASAHLGYAEQVDLGPARLAAGGALILVQLVGALPGAAFLAASLGLPIGRPPVAAALAGVALLAVGWVAWAWYRRRWTRAWELRKAWSLAIHDEAVLALPRRPVAPGEERDLDTDPESVHPFRARSLFPVDERPFVDAVYGSYGHTYRVRGREAFRGTLYSVLLLSLLVLVVLSTGSTVIPPGRWTLALSYDDRRVSLTPSDPSEGRDLTVTGLISGVHPGVMGGRTPWHWLVLADGTHIPVRCGQPRALAAAAEFAGIRVVRPPMVA